MTQQEFKRRFERAPLIPTTLASSALRIMYDDGITAEDAIKCNIKYAVVKEPSRIFANKTVLGYADDITEAAKIMFKFRDMEMKDPYYRKVELVDDTPTRCKVRTFQRGTGEQNTYDFCIIDIPYVLEQCQNGIYSHIDYVRD